MGEISDFLKSKNFNFTPIFDGAFHEVHSGNRKIWFRGHEKSGHFRLSFGDWKTGEKHYQVFGADLSPEELREFEQKLEQEKLEQEKINYENSLRFAKEFETYSTIGSSPYLKKKNVDGFGVRYRPSSVDAFSHDLVVPMTDINGKLWNYQVISPNGDKNYQPGKTGELFHIMGSPGSVLFLAEGYATAASIHMATGAQVCCTFSAHNMVKVGEILKRKTPHLHLVYCADADKAGMSCAKKAVAITGGTIAVPKKLSRGNDFNDLAVEHGLEEVKAQLESFKIPPLVFQTLEDLEKEDLPPIEYLVQDLLPCKGSSIFGGSPKVGKTTLARQLVKCVCDGIPFLGRAVKKGRVAYIGLEDKKNILKPIFLEKLSISNKQNLVLTTEIRSENKLAELESQLEFIQPDLVVIDTLAKFATIEDLNNYSEVVTALTNIVTAVTKYAHVLFIHHAKKGQNTNSSEAMLGSTAISGAVDSVVYVKKEEIGGEEVRTISCDLRYGVEFEKQILAFDQNTYMSSLKSRPENLPKNVEAVLSLLKDLRSAGIADMTSELGMGAKTVEKALLWLKSRGRVNIKKVGAATLWEVNPSWAGVVNEDEDL